METRCLCHSSSFQEQAPAWIRVDEVWRCPGAPRGSRSHLSSGCSLQARFGLQEGLTHVWSPRGCFCPWVSLLSIARGGSSGSASCCLLQAPSEASPSRCRHQRGGYSCRESWSPQQEHAALPSEEQHGPDPFPASPSPLQCSGRCHLPFAVTESFAPPGPFTPHSIPTGISCGNAGVGCAPEHAAHTAPGLEWLSHHGNTSVLTPSHGFALLLGGDQPWGYGR